MERALLFILRGLVNQLHSPFASSWSCLSLLIFHIPSFSLHFEIKTEIHNHLSPSFVQLADLLRLDPSIFTGSFFTSSSPSLSNFQSFIHFQIPSSNPPPWCLRVERLIGSCPVSHVWGISSLLEGYSVLFLRLWFLVIWWCFSWFYIPSTWFRFWFQGGRHIISYWLSLS